MKYISKYLSLLVCIILFFSCDSNSKKNGSIQDFVPKDANIVLKFNEGPDQHAKFDAFKSDLKENKLLSGLVKLKPYAGLLNQAIILDHLQPTTSSLLCLNLDKDSTAVFTFISKLSPNLIMLDSISDKKIETVSINKLEFQKITIEEKAIYSATKDSVFIISSSNKVLQELLNEETQKDPEFKKIFNINDTGDIGIISRGQNLNVSDSISLKFSSWTALDLSVLPDGMFASGVSIARDTIPELLSVFQGQVAQENGIHKITPRSSLNVMSFTFNDPDSIQNKLNELRDTKTSDHHIEIFGSVDEVGVIRLDAGKALALKSIDVTITKEALLRYISEDNNFREINISSFSESELFVEAFSPLVYDVFPKFAFQLENFFVFTENMKVAEEIISAYKNNNCLDKASFFESHLSELSSASSLMFYDLQGRIPIGISSYLNNSYNSANTIPLKNYPLAALQFTYDRDFAHVNFICKEASSSKQTTGTVSEVFNLKLENDLMTDPLFFSNHRTGGKDIVVQDVANNLYLISSNGKVLWKTKLDGAVQGKINEVDILRNGKKQLAFATQKTFYILDRTGKSVAPFPVKFRDPITQPLSIFDYDNNRKYRFVITQGNEVFMYDSKGKSVKGFTFKKTKSTIVLPPQHLRMGNKDYLLIAEESGKLNILSRVGKSRINVSKKFNFSEIPIEKEGSKFVVITSDNKKESISQSGKVSSRTLSVSGSYWFTIRGSTKVTLDDNLLRINGKLVELPFGIYTQPRIFYANKNTFISITETQENKVYVVNKTGTILNGLPVFGSTTAEVVRSGTKGKLNVLAKGDANEVLLYRLQ